MSELAIEAVKRDEESKFLVLPAEQWHDFSEFYRAKKFSHWPVLTPGTSISGGKPLPGRGRIALTG